MGACWAAGMALRAVGRERVTRRMWGVGKVVLMLGTWGGGILVV